MTKPFVHGAANESTRLLIRVDAIPAIGLGHAVRVAAIIAEIAEPLELLIAGSGDALEILFPGATRVDFDRNLPFGTLGASLGADAILVDLPTYTDEMWLPDKCETPVVVIDDWGGPLKADLIINGTVLEQYHRYPRMTEQHRVLIGPQYTLVRPAFGHTAWRGSSAVGTVIVAGSGTRAGEWVTMVAGTGIDRSQWGPLTFVVAVTFPQIDKLTMQCRQNGAALHVGISAEVIAGLLASAKVALITGGMIVYEALATGAPSVVFPQLHNLIPEAKWFAAHGYILDLGFEGGMDPGAVSAAVMTLAGAHQRAQIMSERGRRLIDGQGIIRVATAISDLLAGISHTAR